MNNSFARLVEGMCHQLLHEVLPRVDDAYARSQLWGVINALNTFGLRADWSPALLLQQIEHQQRARGQAVAQPPDLGVCNVGAGRVVRVGEEHDLGALGDTGEDRIDVSGELALGGDHRRRAAAEYGDAIDEEAVLRVDALLTRSEVAMRDQVEQLVRAGAADNARRVEAVLAADRLAQLQRGTVRIAVEMAGFGLECGDGLGAGAERGLVR